MKYTRYNIKPKKKKKRIFPLMIIILFILVLIFLISKGYTKDYEGKDLNNKDQKTAEKKDKSDNIEKSNFILLQCGVFKVKENAEKVKNQVSTIGNPFLVEEDGLIKIYYGIYKDEKECEKEIEKLLNLKVSTSKISISVPHKDLSMVELSKIIEAELKIINKANESEVKSVKTDELKKWVSELKPLDEKSKYYKEVEELKKHINSLPQEVEKKKAGEMNIYIYNQIIKFKESNNK